MIDETNQWADTACRQTHFTAGPAVHWGPPVSLRRSAFRAFSSALSLIHTSIIPGLYRSHCRRPGSESARMMTRANQRGPKSLQNSNPSCAPVRFPPSSRLLPNGAVTRVVRRLEAAHVLRVTDWTEENEMKLENESKYKTTQNYWSSSEFEVRSMKLRNWEKREDPPSLSARAHVCVTVFPLHPCGVRVRVRVCVCVRGVSSSVGLWVSMKAGWL